MYLSWYDQVWNNALKCATFRHKVAQATQSVYTTPGGFRTFFPQVTSFSSPYYRGGSSENQCDDIVIFHYILRLAKS